MDLTTADSGGLRVEIRWQGGQSTMMLHEQKIPKTLKDLSI
jgi:hypothetical protein